MAAPKIEWTDDIDISWHLEGDEVVIDRWNIGGKAAPFDADMFNSFWPSWMLEESSKERNQ